jgi:hypothetical protein
MSISDQIANLATKLATDRETIETLIKSLDDKPNDTTITAQVDQLSASLTAGQTTLSSLQNAERALAKSALPVAPNIVTLRKREEVKPDHLWRAGVVAAVSYFSRQPVEEVLRERYGDSEVTRDLCTLALNRGRAVRGYEVLRGELLTRAAQNPAMTNVAGYAQELVHQTYAAFMDSLKGVSAVSQVNFRSGTFDDGAPIVVPYRVARAAFPDNFDAAFRAEGSPIRVGRLTTASKTLQPFSMGVIGTFTRELLRRSTPSIEEMIRQAMIDDTAEIMDGYVFGAAAGSATRPAGLTNGIAAQDTRVATATPTVADIDSDLQKMVSQLVAVRRLGGPNTSWVMNKANAAKLASLMFATGGAVYPGLSAAGGTLKGYSVAVSHFFPTTEVLLVDGDAIFMAGGAPEFEMSTEATLHEENTTPLPIGTTGTPAVVAAPVRSLYQTNSAALRMIREVSWDDLRDGAVQQLTAVAW